MNTEELQDIGNAECCKIPLQRRVTRFFRRFKAIWLTPKSSVYTKCQDCGSWGICFPDEHICGNCRSGNTIEYYPCARNNN